jgi:aspartyl aminopeptidase
MVTMRAPEPEFAADLLGFIARSPTPWHAVGSVRELLTGAGFVERRLDEPWPGTGGREFTVSGGTIVGWAIDGQPAAAPLRMVGAHTDSPNLRLKPRPDTGGFGYRQLGVEVYGGVLLNSWLDRDLGLAGRIAVRGPSGPTERLIHVDEPIARIPQLAIHLDRDVNERGVALDKQAHLAPVWGEGAPTAGGFVAWLAGRLDVEADDVLGWDLMFHDLTPGTFLGDEDPFIASGRLDNLLSCHAATHALVRAVESGPGEVIPLIVLFDHEEVGSTSAAGATSTLLRTVLERLGARRDGGPEELSRALAGSLLVSSDNAHATHPNYPERHEPAHHIRLNGGPVIKRNVQVRYATDAMTEAEVVMAAERVDVPLQQFVVRSNMACGSTIGPLAAAALGVATVDVGAPQLSMHSAREMAGVNDPGWLAALLKELLHPS